MAERVRNDKFHKVAKFLHHLPDVCQLSIHSVFVQFKDSPQPEQVLFLLHVSLRLVSSESAIRDSLDLNRIKLLKNRQQLFEYLNLF